MAWTDARDDDEQAKLRALAFELRSGGLSYRQVAERLDASVSTVHGWCRDAAASAEFSVAASAPAARARELHTLDIWQQRLDRCYTAGDLKVDRAVAALLRLMDRRARLMGLDAPTRMVIDHGETTQASGVDPRVLRAVREAKRLCGLERAVLDGRLPPEDMRGVYCADGSVDPDVVGKLEAQLGLDPDGDPYRRFPLDDTEGTD